MRINGFRCDQCNKEYLLDPRLIVQGLMDATPDGWFTVMQGRWEHDKEPWLFCSKECLRRHPLTNEKENPRILPTSLEGFSTRKWERE